MAGAKVGPAVAAAVALAAALAGACAEPAARHAPSSLPPADAFTPELEARIAAYMGSDRAPTSEDHVERAELLWDWANAWALEGHTLPVDMTLAVHSYRQLIGQNDQPSPASLQQIDRYLAELALLRERPDALGATRFASHDPLPAAGWATVEQTYTAGSVPPKIGAVFVLGLHFMSDSGAIQFEDPAGDDYVTARVSRAGATLEPLRVPWTSMHAGAGRETPNVAFRLGGADLEPGDTATFVYGDTSGGSRGWAVQTLATTRLVLPIYVDLDGGGRFFSPSWDGLEVIGRPETAALDLFAPSVVRPGETVTLAVRAADAWWNRPSGAIPGFEILLDGEPVTEVAAGGPAVAEVSLPAPASPGVHRYQVRSADGALSARSNPVWVEAPPQPRVVFGELHAHTDFAEAQGTPEEFFRYGVEDARLDFLALTEHDAWLDAGEWRRLQELTAETNAAGRSIAFLAYEWTSQRSTGGHHNVIFRRAHAPLVPFAEHSTLPDLYRGLAAVAAPEDVLVIPHAHTPGDWSTSDPELERLVEIYSMHGSFEWFGNLYLQQGWEVGFIGGSDDHRSRPGLARSSFIETLGQRGGLAAALVPEREPDAVFDALRDLRAYATSGERILLAAELNGHAMGTRQAAGAERRLRARVSGTAPIDRIDVVKNGEVVETRSFLAAPLTGDAWIQVGFESSSEVFPPDRDNPRLYRVWEGTLEVAGAELAAFDRGGVDNRYTESVVRDPAAPGRLRFHVETRGRRDVVLLHLDGATSSTELRFDLGAGREVGVTGGFVRRPADAIPPARFTVRLGELRSGRLDHPLPFERYDDRISVQVVDVDAPMDRDLEWVDLAPEEAAASAEHGDYYYLRVQQLDGGRAWSSPWWLGGTGRLAGASGRTPSR